jgi:hypothetical protein
MSSNTERSGCRFVVAKTAEGKPVIQLELFLDTVIETWIVNGRI